ncbi:MAG TPA: efflux RND transporter periplasmic adaptor subunit [Rhizomicrobium sp.]|jgi:HlyD family secretion protein|nr:efflux RND transporter periplasmic adaptor subunit [Rhizomicrobium sp.]
MDVIRKKPDWKSRFSVLTGGESKDANNGGTLGNMASLSNMDRVVAKKPLWKRLMIPGAVAVIAAGAAVWALSGPGGSVYRVPADQLTLGTVTKGPFEDFIAVRGAVAPLIIDYLTTAQGGTVKQVLVEDGAAVKKGEALIVLSNPALELEVAAQQLTFEQTRFKYQQDILNIDHEISRLKNNLIRDKILLDGKAIAPSIYKQEQDDYDYNVKLRAATIASGDVEQKVRASQLSQGANSGNSANPANGGAVANAQVEALTIRAPMDGQLSALDAEVGQNKASGAVLGQVNSADRFKLTADVDEFYLGRVNIGQETLFTIDGENFKATVAKVYPQVTNGTFKVDFHFDGKAPTGIHVGQAVDLRVELGGASQAVMLPNGPFYQDTGGNWVFVVAPGGNYAMKRNVRLGRRNPQFVEVVDGLSPGEKVIVSGYEAYQKMDRVEFEKSSSGG